MDLTVILLVVLLAVVIVALIVLRSKRSSSGGGVKERVGASEDFPTNSMKEVSVRGKERKKVLVVRTKDGQLHAVGAKCTHYGAPLSKGVLCGNRITCPWHAACFNVTTGDIEDGPVLNSLPNFPITEKDGSVYVTTPADMSGMGRKGRMPRMCKREPSNEENYVIIGGGPAGLAAAQTLREEGFTGHISLISAETELPYDRVKLSKAMGEPIEKLQLRPAGWFDENGIDKFLGVRVRSVDSTAKFVMSENGDRIGYTKLLCCTGGTPRAFREGEPFTIPGADLDNIFTLRSHEDAGLIEARVQALKADRDESGYEPHVIVLGSSFIGMEVAAYMAKTKKIGSVTVVGMEKEPFEIVLGSRIGAGFRALHESKGVEFRLGSVITQFHASDDGEGTSVTAVTVQNLESKESEDLPADIVVIGAGVLCNTDYLDGTLGVNLHPRDRSVVVNKFFEATTDIYAAGDIANFSYWNAPGGASNVRIEHFVVAMDQGRIAARNMLGKEEPYENVPFFWTGQYSASLRYAGRGDGRKNEVIVHGSVAAGQFVAYFVDTDHDVVVAVATLNRDPVAVAAMELLRLGRMPDPAELRAVESLDLASYLRNLSMNLSMVQ